MNLTTFIIVAISSILAAVVWEVIFNIIPAWLNFKREEARVSLTEGIGRLNDDVLINAKIKGGQYLHDNFYKFLIDTLCNKPMLKYGMLKSINCDEESERRRNNFRAEIDSLDKETKTVVNNAIYASSKMFLLDNPIIFFMFLLKVIRVKRDYHTELLRDRMMRSSEYYTINMDRSNDLAKC